MKFYEIIETKFQETVGKWNFIKLFKNKILWNCWEIKFREIFTKWNFMKLIRNKILWNW